MLSVRRKWVSGLLGLGLAAFVSVGCHSAQQFARPPAKPAAQATTPSSTEKADARKAAKGGVKQSTDKTAEAKPVQNEQQLKTEAKQAAATTESAANDLFAGLKKEVGDDPYPSSGQIVNINYSSEDRILKLPGIDHKLAMKIIRNRPYATPTDLMAKHVLTKQEFDRIKDRLTAWDNLWNQPD